MRIVICDDNKEISDEIKDILSLYYKKNKMELPEISIFNSGEKLLNDARKMDIVFLDIEMPGIDGILAGKKLIEKNKDVIVIIVTSYSEYIDDAMRINVFRYISKPIDDRRLIRNYKDALSAFSARKNQKIPIETGDKVLSCNSSDIIMLETFGRKTLIHTVNTTIATTTILQEWLHSLPSETFYQPHRSYIINMAHVLEFSHNEISLSNGNIAYLARRNYSEFKKKWLTYLSTIN